MTHTNPNGARTRIREWYKTYTSDPAPSDTTAVSYPHAPLYASDLFALVEAFDKPCGSCHPCDNYADETWRAADRKPPHVYEWDSARAALRAVAELVNGAEHAAVSVAALRKALDS
jgi:hypothetical protein